MGPEVSFICLLSKKSIKQLLLLRFILNSKDIKMKRNRAPVLKELPVWSVGKIPEQRIDEEYDIR